MKQSELFDCWNHPPYSADIARGEEKITKSWEKNKFVAQCMLCGLIALVGIVYIILSMRNMEGTSHTKFDSAFSQLCGLAIAIGAGYFMVEVIFYRMSPKTPTLDVLNDDVDTLEAELNLGEGGLGKSYYSPDKLRQRTLVWITSLCLLVEGEEVTATNQNELQCLQKLFSAARRFRLVTDEDKPPVLKKYEEFLERKLTEAPTEIV